MEGIYIHYTNANSSEEIKLVRVLWKINILVKERGWRTGAKYNHWILRPQRRVLMDNLLMYSLLPKSLKETSKVHLKGVTETLCVCVR